MDNWLGALRNGRPLALAAMFATVGLALAGLVQAAERKLTGHEIHEHLTDYAFEHADNTMLVVQTFRAQGVTYYYEGSDQTEGRWEVREDKHCSQWPPSEVWTCYNVSVEDTLLTFGAASGNRYEMVKLN